MAEAGKLIFGVAIGDTKALITSQLAGIINGLPTYKIKAKLDLTKGDTEKAVKGVLSSLQKDRSMKLTISNATLSNSAKSNLKAEINQLMKESGLQKAIDSSVKKNMKSLYGASGISTKQISKRQQDHLSYLKGMEDYSKKLQSTWSSVRNKNMALPADSKELKNVTSSYNEMCKAVGRYKALVGEGKAKYEDRMAAQKSVDNFDKEIRNYTAYAEQKKQAAAAAAEAEKNASREAAEEAKRNANATAQQVQSLYKQIENFERKNPKAMRNSEYANFVDRAKQELSDASYKTKDGLAGISEGRLNEIKSAFSSIRMEVDRLGMSGQTVGDRIKAMYQKFGGWSLVVQSMRHAWFTMKDMFNQVKEIDTAMTELKKVTNEDDATYTKFLTNAASRAKDVGATISDTVTATADFARLGYSLSDASQLADAALIYKNVGDGIEDVTTASQSIISTMKAFGIQASDSMHIVDAFNEVGNNFAISSAGIGEAMQRSASALAEGNNTFEESIGLITAMNSTVQDTQKVGTALKTVSMYLRATKTDAEDAGESTDGMASSVSKLRDDIYALTNGGVDIMLDPNTYKSTYQIMKDLSGVWDSLTDITRANILEKIGGKRNANVVSSLLENFDVAESAMQKAMNSTGSAVKENEKYLDSIQGKIQKFKVAFQSLSQTLMSSSMLKDFISLGTGILNIIDKIVGKVGGLKGVASVIGGIVIKKNWDAIGTSLSRMSMYFNQIQWLVGNLGVKGTLNTVGVDGSFIKGLVGTPSFIGATVAGLTILTSQISKLYESAQKSREETISKGKSTFKDIFDIDDQASLVSKYNEYLKVNQAYIDNAASKQELEKATSSLTASLGLESASLPSLAEQYGSVSNALAKYTQEKMKSASVDLIAANAAAKEHVEAEEATKNGGQTMGQRIYGAMSYANKEHNKDLDKYIDKIDGVTVAHGLLGKSSITLNSQLDTSVEGLRKQLSTLDEIVGVYDRALEKGEITSSELANDSQYTAVISRQRELKEGLEDYLTSISNNNTAMAQVMLLDELNSKVPRTVSDFEKLRSKMYGAAESGGMFLGTTEDIHDAIDGVLKESPQLSKFSKYLTDDVFEYTNSKKSSKMVGRMEQLGEQMIEAQRRGATKKYSSLKAEYEDVFESFAKMAAGSGKSLDEYLSDFRPTVKSFARDLDIDLDKALGNHNSTVIKTGEAYEKAAAAMKKAGKDGELAIDGVAGKEDTMMGSGDKMWDSVDYSLKNISILKEAFDDALGGETDTFAIDYAIDKFPELADRTDDLSLAIQELINSESAGISSNFNDIIASLGEDADPTVLRELQQALLDYVNTSYLIPDIDIDVESDGIESFTEAVAEANSETGLLSESINNLNNRYSSLSSFDQNKLYEKTASGVRLNMQELNRLEKAYAQNNILQERTKLAALEGEYERLTAAIGGATNAETKRDLYTRRNNVIDEIKNAQMLIAEYDGLTNALNRYKNVKDQGNLRDNRDFIKDELSELAELRKSGYVGENQFREGVNLMTYADAATMSVDELVKAYDSGITKMKRYFDESGKGWKNFLSDIQAINKAWARKDSDGNWLLDFDVDDVAKQMNLSTATVQTLVDDLEARGFKISIQTEYSSLSDLVLEASQAEAALNELEGVDITFDFSSNDIEDLNSQLSSAKQLLDEMKKDPFTFDASSIKDAETAVAALAMQKSNLEGYSIMHIELSDEHINTKLGEAISLAQQFQKQSGLLEIAVALNKTEDIESIGNSLSEILNTVQKDPDLSKVMMDLEIRTDSKEHFADDLQKVGEDKEVLLKAGLDESEIKNIKPEIKSKVNFDVSGAKSAAEKSQSYFDSVVKQEVTFEIDISQWPDKLKEWLGADGDTITMTVKAETKTESAVQDQNTGEWSYKSETKKVIIDPDDRKLNAVEKRLDDFEKEPKKVTIDANDNASGTLDSVEGKSNAVDGSDPTVDVNANDNASGTLDNVNAQADNFANKNVSPTIGVKDAASGILSRIASLINSIHDKSVTISVTQSLRYTSGSSRTSGGIGGSYNGGRLAKASGTAFSYGSWGTNGSGTALVGELGREIVVRDGKWFTVGDNGAEFFRYKTNDIIFNARQSESLLKYGGIKGISPRGSAFLSGTAFAPGSNVSGVGKDYSSAGSSSSKKSSSSSSSKASSAAKSTADSEKSEFEKAYAYHQHLLKMEQENEEEYLAWLEQAYKDAYAQQKIELDDYYKYEEECFEKRKSIFENSLKAQEHQIWLYAETMENKENAQVAVYQDMMKAVAAESRAARARGLTEEDEYIQELQKKYRDYMNKVEELRQQPYQNAISLIEKQISYEEKGVEDSTQTRVQLTRNMVDVCRDAIQDGYRRGLKDTDEFIIEMKTKMRDATNSIKEMIVGAFNTFSSNISAAISAMENIPGTYGMTSQMYQWNADEQLRLYRAMKDDTSGLYSVDDKRKQAIAALQAITAQEQAEKQAQKNYQSALDDMINRRANQIKKANQDARDAQSDSLSDQIDALQDFYDKQIEMLEDEAEYEDYIKNQKEKRKNIADIEAALAQLELDDSAAAQKRKLQLRQQLAEKTEELNEFERDHARDTVKRQLEDERDAKIDSLNEQLDAVRSYTEDEYAIRQQATQDIMNMNNEQFMNYIDGLIKSGEMTEAEAKEMIEHFLDTASAIGIAVEKLEAFQAMSEFSGWSGANSTKKELTEDIYGYNKSDKGKLSTDTGTPEKSGSQVYNDALAAAGRAWNVAKASGDRAGMNAAHEYAEAVRQVGEGITEYTALDIAGKMWYNGAGYRTPMHAIADELRSKGYQKRYAKGTSHASAGMAMFDELGAEYYFSKDGAKYKMMSAGDKVLNAKATDFLYNFATGKNSAIQELIERMSSANIGAGVESKVVAPIINMGDINVAGDASEHTVSEIRRAQRDQMNFIIKEFNKYSR